MGIKEEGRTMLGQGLVAMAIGMAALGLIVLVVSSAKPGSSVSISKGLGGIGALALLIGSIRTAQGGIMAATGLRIDVENEYPLSSKEKTLTGVFAIGWVVAVIALATVAMRYVF